MKKFISLVCLMSFLSVNYCVAIEDYDEDIITQPIVKEAKAEKIVKKDPGLIKLPNKKEIDKKSFDEKMAKDEKAYRQKSRALSSNLKFIYNDDKKLVKVEKIDSNPVSDEEKEYNKTRNSWLEGYYMFYKVADRILRANDLDTQNWRFLIDKKTEDINAHSTAANLVVINSSFVDSFYDNEDALAFVIGHEISHHIFNHAQIGLDYKTKLVKLDIGLQLSAGFIVPLVPYLPFYIVKNHSYHKKIRNREYEADTESLILMTRAGFNVDYAYDVMSTLAQLPELKTKFVDDTHPKHHERIKNITKQIAVLDVNALKIEGEKNLYEKPVMTLKRSSDKKSIVLVPEKSRGSIHYAKATPSQKNIYKAYSAYLNDDMTKAEKLFEQAYKMNKKDFVPCLYLSYINEYNYKKNHDKESLKKAKKWARRAYRKNNIEKNTIKQKMDVEALK